MKHLVLLCLMFLAAPAQAALKVFACEPEWGALATELGGDKVAVYTATSARQDPHTIEARPSLIARVRSADLVVCTGAELEGGWLPLLLRSAGNPHVQPGTPGFFAAADYVALLDVPANVDRALGDLHAAGNPHLHTDARNIARVAEALVQRLAELDPAQAAHYQARYRDFSTRWTAAIARWAQTAAPLKGVAVVSQHQGGWTYLIRWLGLSEVAVLEPKPGVPASAAHLTQVLARLKTQPAKMVLRAAYQDGKPSEWLAQQSGIRAVVLPYTVGGSERATDLFGLFDDTITRLLEANR
ncbi:MAG: zinc ABC transporter substrate-binding protein [Pseudomonadota bacterium]